MTEKGVHEKQISGTDELLSVLGFLIRSQLTVNGTFPFTVPFLKNKGTDFVAHGCLVPLHFALLSWLWVVGEMIGHFHTAWLMCQFPFYL